MKEILGCDLYKAFADLGIDANITYMRKMIKHEYEELYEVWEVSDDDFNMLCSIKDEDWKDEWGWWRSAEGTNIEGSPVMKAIINGLPIVVWVNEDKLDKFLDDDEPEKDFRFDNLLEYYCNMWGASMEKNICALSVGLARLNGITMGELFKRHVG